MGINPTERNFALLLTLRERKTMPELVIKTAKENGDLPEDFDGQETKLEPITFGDCKIEFKDILNPTALREWFEKVNG